MSYENLTDIKQGKKVGYTKHNSHIKNYPKTGHQWLIENRCTRIA